LSEEYGNNGYVRILKKGHKSGTLKNHAMHIYTS